LKAIHILGPVTVGVWINSVIGHINAGGVVIGGALVVVVVAAVVVVSAAVVVVVAAVVVVSAAVVVVMVSNLVGGGNESGKSNIKQIANPMKKTTNKQGITKANSLLRKRLSFFFFGFIIMLI